MKRHPNAGLAGLMLLAAACTGPSSLPSAGSGPTPARAATTVPSAIPDAASDAGVQSDAGLATAPAADTAADAGRVTPLCDAGRSDAAALAVGVDGGDAGLAPLPPPAGAELPVPGDVPVYVLEALPGNQRALVYLHGRCGQIHAVDSWQHSATEHGTLIALRGDKPCPEQRRRWGTDIDALHRRIQQALRAVKKARKGELVTSDVTLFGYSQGAQRAEGLAQRYPRIYRRVILGGPPTQPSPAHLSRARAVAVFGGDSETTEKMQLGAEDLIAAGQKAHFFLIPCAGHGEYGPEAERVMGEILRFVEDPPAAAPLDAGAD